MKKTFILVIALVGATLPIPCYAAESWIQCDGTLVTTGAAQASKPVHDVYAYSDDEQRLFKYSETRKLLDPVFVTQYSAKEIKWASPGSGSSGDASWEGSPDRTRLALSLIRRERGETTTWKETCKPAQPLPN